MKKSFIFFLIIIAFNSKYCNAQYTEVRLITKTFPIYSSDVAGAGTIENPDAAPEGKLINVITKSPDNPNYYVIEFLDWVKDSVITNQRLFFKYNYKKADILNAADLVESGNKSRIKFNENAKKLFFLAKKEDIDSNSYAFTKTLVKSSQFTVSTIIMPMKLRLKDFDFSGSINLGVAGGWRMKLAHKNENYVNIMFALNLGETGIDSSTSAKGNKVDVAKNISIFSPALGVVWEFGKAQIGVFLGEDMLSKFNQDKYQWIYNKRPWLSIGFGFSILNAQSNKPSTDAAGSNNP